MKIHACMMTQNELSDLSANVERLLPFVDTINIVDGGSQDLTIPYMRNWAEEEPKIRFFIHPWEDNFPAQRNNYLRRAAEVAAPGDFLLAVDPDEVLDEQAAGQLRGLAGIGEERGYNLIGFRCRSVSLKGSKRVFESHDNYWKRLLIKWDPNFYYAHAGPGPVHEFYGGIQHRIIDCGNSLHCPDVYWYEHRKQQNITWPRGLRNMFIGGGGPNGVHPMIGEWRRLREICDQLGIFDWHSFQKYLLLGSIDQQIKDWMITHRMADFGDGACLLPDEYFLTPTGAVLSQDVGSLKGEEVYSRQGISRGLSPMVREYLGPIVEIQGVNTMPLRVTSDHRILVAERIECSRESLSMSHCRPDCSLSIPQFRTDNRNPKWSGVYKNCSTEYRHELKWVKAKDIEPMRHCLLFPKVAAGSGIREISNAKAEVWGMYLGDGNINGRLLEFSMSENDPIGRIVALCQEAYPEFEVVVHPYPKKHYVKVVIRADMEITSWYKESFGPRAIEKKVPKEVFSFSSDQLKAFLRGYILADGCIYKKRSDKAYYVVSTSTASPRLVRETYLLFSKLGILPGFDRRTSPNRFSRNPIYRLIIEGRQVNRLDFLSVINDGQELKGSSKQYFYQDDDFFYLPCTGLIITDYEGPVYNIETEDNTYLSSCIVHNSEFREAFKTYFYTYHPEELLDEYRNEHIP